MKWKVAVGHGGEGQSKASQAVSFLFFMSVCHRSITYPLRHAITIKINTSQPLSVCLFLPTNFPSLNQPAFREKEIGGGREGEGSFCLGSHV